MVDLKTEKRILECALTPTQREQRSSEAHALLARIEDREREHASLREQAKAVQADIEQMTHRHRALSHAARTGIESRNVDVQIVYDGRQVVEVRGDTGQVLDTRPPTSDDRDLIKARRQMALPGTEPAPTPPVVPEPAEEVQDARCEVAKDGHRCTRSTGHRGEHRGPEGLVKWPQSGAEKRARKV